MKNLILLSLIVASCASTETAEVHKKRWPKKITELKTGLIVEHNKDTVYATLNTKDPETHGKFQLQFTTTVSSKNGNVTISEFGAYLWKNEAWEPISIFDRPFNRDEFSDWYGAENGIVKKGEQYSDTDNWLTKSDHMNGDTITALLYFIGTNTKNEKVVGADEIVGICREK